MKTSEQLEALAERVQEIVGEARRLENDLPPGRTCDVAELTGLDAGRMRTRLLQEAAVLRRCRD